MNFTLCLPFPISANRLWRKSRSVIHISREYKTWKIEAEGWFMQQKKATKPVAGNFNYHITLDERRRKQARDGDNRGKCVLDFIQRMGLIEDDKLANKGTWEWGQADGCIVTVEAA
jgi:Holliday junction resolvase RusA-like endonuclease